MAQLFKRWSNYVPLILVVVAMLGLATVIGFFSYFGSPRFTDVGYAPQQPVPYSHALHAGDLGMDCRYCHHAIEAAPHANLPPTQTCMNCHEILLPESSRLMPVRESWSTGLPIAWNRIHLLPDYAYFNHSAHLHAGVGCSSCHGLITRMAVVAQAEPLSMGWCLACHRHPESSLRPAGEITSMVWKPDADQARFAAVIMKQNKIAPPQDCSGCHR
ncbi:MAG TPA: cytochrome c3 family protein [bacterium]|nr:cytochrome c3 family protein [bacterium]